MLTLDKYRDECQRVIQMFIVSEQNATSARLQIQQERSMRLNNLERDHRHYQEEISQQLLSLQEYTKKADECLRDLKLTPLPYDLISAPSSATLSVLNSIFNEKTKSIQEQYKSLYIKALELKKERSKWWLFWS